MAYAFAPISAKPTFGTLRDNLSQSDYIKIKKNNCKKAVYSLGRCRSTCNSVNYGNLIMGQYSKMDLSGACTVIPTTPCNIIDECEPCKMKEPVPIQPAVETPFYFNNTIDPIGTLFGNSQCGEQNYSQYMVLNIPK
jgi:hypothetical protein